MIGIDLASIDRIAALVRAYDARSISILFTTRELEAARRAADPQEALAFSFAAKEAIGKALGTGLSGFGWNDIEAVRCAFALDVTLYGDARRIADSQGIRAFDTTCRRVGRQVLVAAYARNGDGE